MGLALSISPPYVALYYFDAEGIVAAATMQEQ